MPPDQMSQEQMERIAYAAKYCPQLRSLLDQASSEGIDSCELAARCAEQTLMIYVDMRGMYAALAKGAEYHNQRARLISLN